MTSTTIERGPVSAPPAAVPNLYAHAGSCLQCYDNLDTYRREFRSLVAREVDLGADHLAKMRDQLCDTGKIAFECLLAELQTARSE